MRTDRNVHRLVGGLVAGMMLAGTAVVLAADGKPNAIVPLSKLNSEVYLLRENLNRTMSALEQLKGAAANNGDLTKPYEAYSSAYEQMEKQLASAREHGTAARARAKEHYEAWQKELTDMQNPALREKAQKRFTAASGEFQKIVDRVATAKETFAPLAGDLKDINTYLKTDLSNDAVSSLSNTIWKMGHKAKSVDGKLADVNEQIEKTMKKLPQT